MPYLLDTNVVSDPVRNPRGLADVIYGTLRARLERIGRPIGGNDLLIAAQSPSLRTTLVTDNEREFRQIEELPVENWLR